MAAVDGFRPEEALYFRKALATESLFRRRPVVVWQSNALTGVLQSVLVVPLTTNIERANLAGTALINASPDGPRDSSVALAFQLRAIPQSALQKKSGT
jgi:mRNA-degrading endonuclease toxin of MazEF toxin-antitoxin module